MRRVLIAAAVLLAFATGCAQIPTSGPVETIAQRGREAPSYDVNPRLPKPGEDPLGLVTGFLGAMADGTGDYAIARKFLTDRAEVDWRPGYAALIYEADDQPKLQGDTVVMDTVVVGRLDGRGSFSRSHDRLMWDFKLVKVGPEWRISNPPVGLMINTLWFSTNFAPMHLYFFDPSWQALVPDVFFVPKYRRTPQFLINQLVQGPSEWLRPAVVSALPRNTRALMESPSPDTVNAQLGEETASADQAARQLMGAQIAATLQDSRPQITYMSLTLGRSRVSFQGARSDGTVELEQFRRYLPSAMSASSTLFGIKAGKVVTIVDKQGQGEVTPTDNVRVPAPPESLAVSLGADQMAMVTNKGTELWWSRMDPTKEPVKVAQGAGLLTPQFTRSGEVWSVSSGPSGTEVAKSIGGQPSTPVVAPELADMQVQSFRISPDGVRVVVAGIQARKPIVAMLRVERGEIVSLRGLRPLDLGNTPQSPRAVLSVSWESSTHVVALAETGDSAAVHPWAFDVDGAVVEPRATLTWSARALTSSPFDRSSRGLTPMAVFGGDAVWRYTMPASERRSNSGASWLLYARDVSFVCYPG